MRSCIFVLSALLLIGAAFWVPEGRGRPTLFAAPPVAEEEGDPPEVQIGERLFRETRFAQFFFAHSAGPNSQLPNGDTSIAELPMANGGQLMNPYAGKSINCATCHFVDEALEVGMRSYADFSIRSLVPHRAEDLEQHTPRNSPPIVGMVSPGKLLHFDGEFASAEELTVEGWTGRNFGWLPRERATAIRHIAHILRADDGSFAEREIPYRELFRGHPEFPLPPGFRVDPDSLSDPDLVRAASRFVEAYMESLRYERTSPYDRFLEKNSLPTEPAPGELPRTFHHRLLREIEKRGSSLLFVAETEGSFRLHDHPFRFGPTELQGLKIFLEPTRGNCASCHHLPDFTDHQFHNTGISQLEYDSVHRPGDFKALAIPSLADRRGSDLPPSAKNPDATGVFRSAPRKEDRRHADLGLWNIFANPDLPAPQAQLRRELCLAVSESECGSDDLLLEAAIARFKTPSLRNLGQSAPYFHDGSAVSLDGAIVPYIAASVLAQRGHLRNPDAELLSMRVSGRDRSPLAAFLMSLDEDYE